MKTSRIPRPLRPPLPTNSPGRVVGRALPLITAAALVAGCSLSTAPGENASTRDPTSGDPATGGSVFSPYDYSTQGGAPYSYMPTGGTGGVTTNTGGSSFGLGGSLEEAEIGLYWGPPCECDAETDEVFVHEDHHHHGP